MFKPKLFDTLSNYSRSQFYRDLIAGIIVGLVALPLAIAFGIASGVSPEKGLVTAIVGGIAVSALGGSKVQIGGPTGAFIVIVYGIVQTHGVNGLIIATLMAGIMLVLMGVARLGSIIKFIPYPLIIGFTSGIALIIFSAEIRDFFGLQTGVIPAGFIDKWKVYFHHFSTVNIYAIAIGVLTILSIQFWPRVTGKIPGSIIAILITTAVVRFFNLPVETIGSRFGVIEASFPRPVLPSLDMATLKNLLVPAFTIALLAGIESLLSAVVADGMIGGNHKSNMELIAQGIANLLSASFGGIPVTGAIARTATNIRNGGRTPVAGIVHAITLLFILLVFGKWASLVPMATLAGILVVVAYHMSEWKNFRSMLNAPGGDIAVMLITFFLTVLVDLTVAIEIGMILSSFLFMRNMIQITEVQHVPQQSESVRLQELENLDRPREIMVFEISGPFFFGAVYKFKDAIRVIEKPPRVLIIRMGQVPIIDATGLRMLREINSEFQKKGSKVILSEVTSPQIIDQLRTSRLLFAIGKANVTDIFENAVKRSRVLLQEFESKNIELKSGQG